MFSGFRQRISKTITKHYNRITARRGCWTCKYNSWMESQWKIDRKNKVGNKKVNKKIKANYVSKWVSDKISSGSSA